MALVGSPGQPPDKDDVVTSGSETQLPEEEKIREVARLVKRGGLEPERRPIPVRYFRLKDRLNLCRIEEIHQLAPPEMLPFPPRPEDGQADLRQ